jgi:hypothetical protein
MITLFGLTIIDNENVVWPSGNTKFLLETQDYPLFFRAFCDKFQFPNCINVWTEAKLQASMGVRFKPAQYILQVLQEANLVFPNEVFYVSNQEISHLIFNDIRVAKGEITPKQVLQAILDGRAKKTVYPGGSNLTQHGREFLGYMTLAHLLKTDESGRNFCLNSDETKAIEHIIKNRSFIAPPKDIDDVDAHKKFCEAWDLRFKRVTTEDRSVFKRRPRSFTINVQDRVVVTDSTAAATRPNQQSLNETGDEGELYVLKYEKELVAAVRPDKVALVARVANDTSLGYDIQSLELPDCSRKKYIEVKSTIRTFPPNEEILTFFPMSGNEWETARHQQDSYYIYRVVLLENEVKMYIVQNPVQKESDKKIILEVKEYRVVLKHNAVDSVYSLER